MRQTQKVVGDRGQGILRYQKDGAGKIWIHRITVSNVLVAQQDEILDSMYDNLQSYRYEKDREEVTRVSNEQKRAFFASKEIGPS